MIGLILRHGCLRLYELHRHTVTWPASRGRDKGPDDRLSKSPGQDDPEEAALPLLRFELDAAPVRLDRPACDGEA